MLAWGLAQLAGGTLLLLQPMVPHVGVFLLSLPFALASLGHSRSRWLAAFWFGAALAALQASAVLDDRLDPALDGEVVDVTGRIVDLVEQDGRRQRFLFRIERGEYAGQAVALPELVRLGLYDDMPIATGERWHWRVKLRRPRGLANPGTFDYERWLFTQRIGATGYVRDPQTAERIEAAEREWRATVAARVAGQVEGPAAGLVRALATADRGGISDAQWETLRLTGTSHLVAISGLHIGLVAGLVLWLAAVLRRRWLPRLGIHWPPMLAATTALAYGALSGFGLPVQRALVAALVLLGALAARRAVLPGHAFGFALAAVLCLDPLAPLSVGFWLSFGAVAAIIYLVAGRRPAGSPWQRALWVQLGLFALLAPLTLTSFGQVSLVSPFANLVAIPLFAFAIVPLVLAGLLLLGVPTASAWVFSVTAWLLEKLLSYLDWLAGLDPALSPAPPGPFALLLVFVGLLLLLAPRALPGRWLAPFLLLPAVWPNAASEPAPLVVHFLDVGQGLSVVVETPSHTLVYDTGPNFGGNDAGAMVVVPFLHSRARSPEVLMVSHADNDHAGGVESLREAFPGLRVVGRTGGRRDADCVGMSWQWDGVEFDVLHPLQASGDGNDTSCVLRIRRGSHSVLLTGDIEAAAEARLLRRHRDELHADVVLLPHHGSMTSSSPAFVAAVQPRLAIAAAGYGNRWGFPREPVVRRWRDAGAAVITTGEQGAIAVMLGEDMRWQGFREERRLWREAAPQRR